MMLELVDDGGVKLSKQRENEVVGKRKRCSFVNV
jgi:hypothetical protein